MSLNCPSGKEPTDRQTDRQSLDWGRGERDDGWWGFSETTRKVIWLNLLSVKSSQFILFSTSDNMGRGYYHEIHLIALNEMHTKFSAIDSPSVPIAHQCNQMMIFVQCCLSSRVIPAFSPIKTLMGPVVLQPAVNRKREASSGRSCEETSLRKI